MATVTFTTDNDRTRDVTVYAVAGDTSTILTLAEKNNVKIPFDCRDGNCGSCLIEVNGIEGAPKMAINLTEKEKAVLKDLGKITAAEIEAAEVDNKAPHYRLACQFIARDEDIRIKFSETGLQD